MSYETDLLEVRETYPFDKWKTYAEIGEAGEEGLEQYTEENCEAAKLILDTLVSDLAALGGDAPKEDKLQKFQAAVEALNTLNDEIDDSLIETGEREELCELFNVIAVKAGIDPSEYGDGEGPTGEWRDW
ncbi:MULTISPECIES: hypothetical protein [Cyanophyceae]|uniref:hypothetical protein n=1 Tax=Cyanophyceae TaxID=3028117 RepID=UPI0016892297|nr:MULTISPECIES: hypothetical protein [Cyanophyceae]MBD1918630.1 hypothetical protein [Phormidium sp. FACHB-77]MBD2031107.1 hypothetical protein [Phormidium sp. FACHB-322]MBD2051093.1 hypothetical protein [Leptolyngbya sp. FACHB-60]